MIIEDRSNGNNDVLNLLEKIRERTTTGEINSIIVIAKNETQSLVACAGDIGLIDQLGMIENAKLSLFEAINSGDIEE